MYYACSLGELLIELFEINMPGTSIIKFERRGRKQNMNIMLPYAVMSSHLTFGIDRIESSPLNEQPHSSTTTLLLSSVAEASLPTRAVETDTIVSSSRQPSLVVTEPGITSLIKTTDGSTTTTAVAPSTVDPMLNGFMNHTTADIVWTILLLVLVIIVVIGTIATGIVLLLFSRKMVSWQHA